MKTSITWKGHMTFTGLSACGIPVEMDSDPSLGGSNNGVRPMEMIAMGLAGCLAMDILSILLKKRQDVTSSFLLLVPPAIMMGIPFPAGLRLLTQKADVNVAWAWGVNVCLSVVGTVVAPIASVEGGFLAVMALSIVAYRAAGIAAMWHVRIGTDRRQGTCVA